jgi:short subunit dehydrogenase-like uncharacterized protein
LPNVRLVGCVNMRQGGNVETQMGAQLLIYGANGYTGEIIAGLCQKNGVNALLAGRDGAKIAALGRETGFEVRVFGLENPAEIDAGLRDVAVVLHCAGPFSRTSKPMVEGCLRNGVHYLDITGEIEVFEALAARDAEARKAGVMVMPGVGFDVAPSDCLAAHLKRRLPAATRLTLAFQGLGGVSHGTATTMIEKLGQGGAVRRDGKIVNVPAAWKTLKIDFGRGPVQATTIPWGDVSTAFYSTGIPNIEVYTVIPPPMRRLMVASRYLGGLLASGPVQNFLKARIAARPAGPSPEQRERGATLLYGEATDDASGNRVAARQKGPEGYKITSLAALLIAEKALSGNLQTGFQTPAKAYGPDLILEIGGVTRENVGL